MPTTQPITHPSNAAAATIPLSLLTADPSMPPSPTKKRRLPPRQQLLRAWCIGLSSGTLLLFAYPAVSYAAVHSTKDVITATPTATTNAKAQSKATSKKPKPSAWKGSNANLGLQANSGNSQAVSLLSAVNVLYSKTAWDNNLQFQADYGTDDTGRVSKESYNISNQTNLNIYPKHKHPQFLFARGDFTIAKFSPYYYTQNLNGGYGFTAINRKRLNLKLQAGPGYLHTVSKNGHRIVEDSYSANAQANLIIYLRRPDSTLGEVFSDTISKPYNLIKSETSLNHNITRHFAVSAIYQLSYYSRIPSNSHHTRKIDTITSINLVYNL